ncbi:MAG: NAD(P)-dependent oxidoreductase [Candidatus Nanopelagicales bacterium]
MSKKIVLITGTSLVLPEAHQLVRDRGYEVRHVDRDQFTVDELHDALDGVAGYLIGGYEEPLAVHFERAKDLEAAAWVGTDYKAYVPGWKKGWELGVAFLNSPGTNATSVAEFSILLALTMMRPFVGRVVTAEATPTAMDSPGHDLAGHTLGILGLGRIGARVAHIASNGFGMQTCYSAPRRNEPLEHSLGISYVSKESMLEQSDVISLHRPGPSENEGPELDREQFEIIRDGAVLVNTAHHNLVDLDSLLWAANNRSVRAAFDGVSEGPAWDRLVELGPHRFLSVPSMAFNSSDANLRASLRTASGVCDVLDGGSNPDVNNPDFRSLRN